MIEKNVSINTATLTFHSPNNNGSFLQAYALQKVLLKSGINNRIINFYTEKQESQYSVFRLPKSVGDCVRNIISLLHYKDLKDRFNRFDDLRTEYLKMTERFLDEQSTINEAEQYDTVICGSDQIWNTAARDFSKVYLLESVGNKKITYAVSCGSHIEDIDQALVIKNAKHFNALSVRERSTQKFFHEKGLVNASMVLDPTLLLDREDYAVLFQGKPIISEEYIFLYTINYNDEILSSVKELGKHFKLPVYTAFTGYSCYKCKKYGIKVLYNVAPDSFLNLLSNASYVCSNSFHGVAFSIIYEKDFYRLCNTDNFGNQIIDDRIDSILGELGLTNANYTCRGQAFERRLDYTSANVVLQKLKEESIKFLMDNI